MGDLDDFFAKKDKKKSKNKKNVVVAANLYDEMKKENEGKKEKKKNRANDNAQPMSEVLRKTKEDEDWEDFDEPQDVNLEGLKVANLSDKLKQEEDRHQDGSHPSRQRSDDGHHGGADSDEAGPWRRVAASEAPEAPVKETSKPAAPAPVAPAADEQPQKSRYVPPAMRNQQNQQTQPGDVMAQRPLVKATRRKNAPNINDVGEFPTLGNLASSEPADADNADSSNHTKFENVKDSGRSRPNPADSKPDSVSLTNRWGDLQREECL